MAATFFQRTGVFVHSSIAFSPIFLQQKLPDVSFPASVEDGDEDEGDSEEEGEDATSWPANARVTILSLIILQRTTRKGGNDFGQETGRHRSGAHASQLARLRNQTQAGSEKRRSSRLSATPQTVHTHSHALVLADTHTRARTR